MDAFGWSGNPEVVRGGSRSPGKPEANCRAPISLSQCTAPDSFSFFSRPAKLVRVRRFLLCSCRSETQRRAIAPERKRPALDKGRIPVVKGRFRQDRRSRTYTDPRNRGAAKPDQY